jgi:hypothetical protein
MTENIEDLLKDGTNFGRFLTVSQELLRRLLATYRIEKLEEHTHIKMTHLKETRDLLENKTENLLGLENAWNIMLPIVKKYSGSEFITHNTKNLLDEAKNALPEDVYKRIYEASS